MIAGRHNQKRLMAIAREDERSRHSESCRMECSYDDLEASDEEEISSQSHHFTSEIECIKHIKRLTQEISSIEVTPESIGQQSKHVKSLLEKSNKLALDAYHGSAAAMYDIDLMSASGRTVSKMTQALEIDSCFFQANSFPTHLKKYMNQSINSNFTQSNWLKLSANDCHDLLCGNESTPIIQYTFGSFSFEADANAAQSVENGQKVPYEGRPPNKKPRSKLSVTTERQVAQIINAQTAKEKVEKDRTVIEVENLFETLESLSRSNQGHPVPYLTLVVDKNDFGKTVENIFHLSFLIKEGYAEIRVVEMGGKRLTVVKCVPEDERQKGDRQRSSAQVALTVTEKLWQEWCEKIKNKPYRL